MRSPVPLILAATFFGLVSPNAEAHPHVFVDGRAELVFDKTGAITAVENVWTFDKAFTAFATEGLDINRNGKFDADELKPLAKTNVESLADYDYFTYLSAGGAKVALLAPKEYHLEYAANRLTLYFTLPVKTPVPAKTPATLTVFDKEYFVAFTFPKQDAVKLVGASASCKTTHKAPKPLDDAIMLTLSGIPIDQRDLPPDLEKTVLSLSDSFTVSCP